MLAADDGKPGTRRALHEVRLLWNDPHDSPDAGKKVYDSMFPIVEAAYHARGGKNPKLPGRAGARHGGRADVRFSIDAERRIVSLQQERRRDPRGGRGDRFLTQRITGMVKP